MLRESVRAVVLPVNRGTLAGAGFVSGMTGTASSIGGPPMALLIQNRSATQIRSTLAIYIMVGAEFSLVGLGLTGSLEWSTIGLGGLYVPCLVVGFFVARWLRRRLPANRLRGWILVVCGVSALVLLARSPG